MTMFSVLLLPLVALAMLIFLPLLGGDRNISTKFRSRKRRKIWLGRLAVFMLLISTVITLAWPVQGMSSLVQGLLITALVMVPAIFFNLLVTLHYGSSSNGFSRWSSDDDEDQWFDSAGDNRQGAAASVAADDVDQAVRPARDFSTAIPLNSDHTPYRQPSTAIPLSSAHPSGRRSTSAIHLPTETSEAGVSSAFSPPREAPKDRFSTPVPLASEGYGRAESEAISLGQQRDESLRPIILGGEDHRSVHTTPEVEDQLRQVSKLVQSHNIGGDTKFDDESMMPMTTELTRGATHSVLNQSIDLSGSTDLSAMTTQQISSLVTSLKEEKGKLQKLVIAQHAVIESEREASTRNRGLARDAIKIMQGARKHQKMAEKMARRERTERQRLELEYKKVSVALSNAMSIISSRQGSSNPAGGQ